jgi:moderate conductance mechanosensitive channel
MLRALFLFLALLLAATAPAAAQFGGGATQQEGEDTATSAQEIEQLIRILEDDAARSRLIETLRAAAAPDDVPPPAAEPRLAQQLAEYTRGGVEAIAGLTSAAVNLVAQIGAVFSGAVAVDVRALVALVTQVVVVIATTFGVYFLLRLLARRAYRPMADIAQRAGLLRRIAVILAAIVIDFAIVAAAWAIGQGVAVNVSQGWRMGINQTLFLNAFLIVELAKVVVRAPLAPHWPSLRPVRIDDTTAAYWYFWISRIISVVGYTMLFVAPILDANVSRQTGEAVRVVVMLAALLMAWAIVVQNKLQVRALLLRAVRTRNGDFLGRPLAMLASVWHIIAIAYLVVVFVLWLANQEAALPFVLSSTLHSIVAVIVGMILSALVTRFATRGMRLPDDLKERLPLLEVRLNAFVPNVLRVLRLIILLGVLIAIAHAWKLADIIGWLSSEGGQQLLGSGVSLAIVLALAGGAYLAVQSWIEYRLNPNYGTVPTARERTLLSLFRNAFTIVLAILVLMLVLSELGVNIGPLLAGAGVVGLAIGFGAQTLVRDIISGAFIQFENAMNEGDVVTAGGITGVVEKLTIRSVAIRTLDGVYHVVPFSSIEAVSNFMKHYAYHVAAIGVAYREKIPEVKQAMSDAFDQLMKTEHHESIIGGFEMHGVTDLGDSAVVVRGRIKTAPGEQWAVGRAYNEIVKELFDERNIEIPFPHMTVYMGANKDGGAPPLHIAQDIPAAQGKSTSQGKPAAGKSGRRATPPAEPGGDAPRRRRRKKSATTKDTTSDLDLPGGEEV